MTIGFLLLTINENHTQNIYKQLNKSPNITEIYNLYGEYDLLMKINAETTEHLGRIIFDTIQSLEGITSTKTMISTL
jgi:DNA-binding Lrp family transcriptional regulator